MIYSPDQYKKYQYYNISKENESLVTCIVLHGNEFWILNSTIDFFLPTNRFDKPLGLIWNDRCLSFYSWVYGYIFAIFKLLIFTFRYYFLLSLRPIGVMVPGGCCFSVTWINFHFHKNNSDTSHKTERGIYIYLWNPCIYIYIYIRSYIQYHIIYIYIYIYIIYI